MAGVCVLLITAGWIAQWRVSRSYREEELRRIQGESAFIASALEEHARRLFRTADTALRLLAHEVVESGVGSEHVRFAGAMAKDDLAAVQVGIADARGNLVYSALPMTAPINIADREHFRVHAERPDVGLFIGRPVQNRASGSWAFFLSRRIDAPDGSFAGVVTLGLDPFYFRKIYGDLRIGQERAGIIVGRDHVVRVRISRGEDFVGDDIGYSPVFREAERSPAGQYRVVTGISHRARIASYRVLPDYPVIVIVSALEDEALALWRRRTRVNAGVTAILDVLILLGGALLLRAQALARRREAEARELQERLVHSQKLEAIGTLAGGVAHDFNNMLGVILGHVEFAREEAGLTGSLRESLDEIEKAARRSASVTRQLLAFARRQAIAPRILDLHAAIEAHRARIGQLMGERIALRWNAAPDVWRVRIDPSQLEQLLTHLATNARDAIAGEGTVTIEAGNATLGADWSGRHPGAVPGDYAVLGVHDTGAGIRPEDLQHIFEPFFTTKETGKGTGLGLATVYGIVQQNAGVIEVESAPGQGATFRVYLPRAVEERPAPGPTA